MSLGLRARSFAAAGALCLLVAASGCEDPPPVAASPARAPAPSQPDATGPAPSAPVVRGLGTIKEAGKTFRPSHCVIVWDAAEQELKFHLYPFAPSEKDVEEIRRGSSFITFSHSTPDASQWPDHCPSATYVLSWDKKPASAIGDLSQARYLLHLHGISRKNANMSLNQLGVEGKLEGQIAAGEQVRLVVKDSQTYGEAPISWDLNLSGQVLIPPPPPKAPVLSADQKGSLGVVTFGEQIYKVEGALAKRAPGESLARVALLKRAPTDADREAYRKGDASFPGKEHGGYVEIYLFCGSKGFGDPPRPNQRKLILRGLEQPFSSTSFFMSEEGFEVQGGLEPGQRVGLKAKGLEASKFSSSLGKVCSWELSLADVEVLEAGE